MKDLDLVVQTSLDGFVAGVNGEFDNFIGDEENLAYVCSIIDEADTALFGRKSFELLNSNWPTAANRPGATQNIIKYSNWYNAVLKIVISGNLTSPENSQNILVINETFTAEISKIKQTHGKSILIFGSPSIVAPLLQAGLIDHLFLIVHPVLFGKGIKLFKEMKKVINLTLLTSQQLSNGTLCNKYAFKITPAFSKR